MQLTAFARKFPTKYFGLQLKTIIDHLIIDQSVEYFLYSLTSSQFPRAPEVQIAPKLKYKSSKYSHLRSYNQRI